MKRVIICLTLLLSIYAFANVNAEEANNSVNLSENSTNFTDATNVSLSTVEIINFFPKEFKIGDAQFNIQVKNNKNETIHDSGAFVTGNGYSTYEVVSIESLDAGSKDYIFIYGNFKEPGNLTLSIKILGETFYQNVSIIDLNNASQKELDDLKKQQEKTNLLNNLSSELKDIKQNFTSLEDQINEKKDNNYDVSKVNLNDLKGYIGNAQINILEGNADEARINIDLAVDEYAYQKSRLDSAKKSSILARLKENAVLFSAIAGAVIMFFTLYELLKRKSEGIVNVTSRIVKKKKGKK